MSGASNYPLASLLLSRFVRQQPGMDSVPRRPGHQAWHRGFPFFRQIRPRPPIPHRVIHAGGESRGWEVQEGDRCGRTQLSTAHQGRRRTPRAPGTWMKYRFPFCKTKMLVVMPPHICSADPRESVKFLLLLASAKNGANGNCNVIVARVLVVMTDAVASLSPPPRSGGWG